jgi:hypothetical protein
LRVPVDAHRVRDGGSAGEVDGSRARKVELDRVETPTLVFASSIAFRSEPPPVLLGLVTGTSWLGGPAAKIKTSARTRRRGA